MSKIELLKRYIFFFLGLFINSFGISFITKASLGTSPISSVPYTLSLAFTPTLGMFTLYMSIVLIIIQLILLRKNFPKQYWLQLPISFLFSGFIDLTMYLLNALAPETYIVKFLCLLLGCAILGFGVFMEIVADVVMLPGECFVNAISKTFHTDFGKTKVAFDSSMAISAAIMSLILFRELAGVREGTIIAAVLVGMIARFLKRKIGARVERTFFYSKAQREAKAAAPQAPGVCGQEPVIITVAREYGSGGRQIAKQVAEKLNFAFYDREIISKTAERLHMAESEVEKKDQKLSSIFLYDMFSQFYEFSEQQPILDEVYEAEKQVILDAAAKGSCVIVGRCSDYICRELANVKRIFLYAGEAHKVQEIMAREGFSEADAQKRVKEVNRERASHYKYYTGKVWGLAENYDLCIDTGKVGVDKTVDLITSMI
ncbi:cytidylate kinase family protein [Anaerovorax odorimutans]|uniref:Cytidylate kinase family protein n=1 Tax=Anaerovorax odorimutans TaxID=109327 RepID=A0ABT1RMQ3_9FIRM|nr:cytidylate kinase family protein [Anaerovorax odorimutans]MCQ4636206.1 cytidylate kinase family protein [Anaerovorax odorimutans]